MESKAVVSGIVDEGGPLGDGAVALVGNPGVSEPVAEAVATGPVDGAVEQAVAITRTATRSGHGRRLDRVIVVFP